MLSVVIPPFACPNHCTFSKAENIKNLLIAFALIIIVADERLVA
jgi:hypothetical protein